MLTPDALAELMTSDTPHAVLDVRERGAYERGHVFRTTSLPRRQLEFRMPALVTAPATPLALIDADGALAPLAATALGTMGYRAVRVLTGGRGASRTAPDPGEASRAQATAVAERVAAEDRVKSLSVEDERQLWEERRERNVYLVDVRTADEYE